ncbi:hypothetical protein BDK51DRAFT_43124 [Blyttiomyces helicus]|uniref:Uncharacterized protein n=1 Tax=Blyttiomyces helicus TaxID=388810 RepID=A0A4P9WEJ6_9FUNG|nr:hypothetical protein BDK51DRAFT_43124 [Blyttiomyces helicus]|eukprot:RKO90133.1 hypothetical protein BDK51DRAFT_43124 [Blyttiomyces helicus]
MSSEGAAGETADVGSGGANGVSGGPVAESSQTMRKKVTLVIKKRIPGDGPRSPTAETPTLHTPQTVPFSYPPAPLPSPPPPSLHEASGSSYPNMISTLQSFAEPSFQSYVSDGPLYGTASLDMLPTELATSVASVSWMVNPVEDVVEEVAPRQTVKAKRQTMVLPSAGWSVEEERPPIEDVVEEVTPRQTVKAKRQTMVLPSAGWSVEEEPPFPVTKPNRLSVMWPAAGVPAADQDAGGDLGTEMISDEDAEDTAHPPSALDRFPSLPLPPPVADHSPPAKAVSALGAFKTVRGRPLSFILPDGGNPASGLGGSQSSSGSHSNLNRRSQAFGEGTIGRSTKRPPEITSLEHFLPLIKPPAGPPPQTLTEPVDSSSESNLLGDLGAGTISDAVKPPPPKLRVAITTFSDDHEVAPSPMRLTLHRNSGGANSFDESKPLEGIRKQSIPGKADIEEELVLEGDRYTLWKSVEAFEGKGRGALDGRFSHRFPPSVRYVVIIIVSVLWGVLETTLNFYAYNQNGYLQDATWGLLAVGFDIGWKLATCQTLYRRAVRPLTFAALTVVLVVLRMGGASIQRGVLLASTRGVPFEQSDYTLAFVSTPLVHYLVDFALLVGFYHHALNKNNAVAKRACLQTRSLTELSRRAGGATVASAKGEVLASQEINTPVADPKRVKDDVPDSALASEGQGPLVWIVAAWIVATYIGIVTAVAKAFNGGEYLNTQDPEYVLAVALWGGAAISLAYVVVDVLRGKTFNFSSERDGGYIQVFDRDSLSVSGRSIPGTLAIAYLGGSLPSMVLNWSIKRASDGFGHYTQFLFPIQFFDYLFSALFFLSLDITSAVFWAILGSSPGLHSGSVIQNDLKGFIYPSIFLPQGYFRFYRNQAIFQIRLYLSARIAPFVSPERRAEEAPPASSTTNLGLSRSTLSRLVPAAPHYADLQSTLIRDIQLAIQCFVCDLYILIYIPISYQVFFGMLWQQLTTTMTPDAADLQMRPQLLLYNVTSMADHWGFALVKRFAIVGAFRVVAHGVSAVLLRRRARKQREGGGGKREGVRILDVLESKIGRKGWWAYFLIVALALAAAGFEQPAPRTLCDPASLRGLGARGTSSSFLTGSEEDLNPLKTVHLATSPNGSLKGSGATSGQGRPRDFDTLSPPQFQRTKISLSRAYPLVVAWCSAPVEVCEVW